jgi:MFS-type transporter involved in bile tolerance (Atg22 family)
MLLKSIEKKIEDLLGAKMLKQFERAKNVYAEYPRTFWTLVLITFVDRVGGAMLFPFFALYLTKKFEIGMTQVGVLFAAFSVSSFIGSMLGGALTDRLAQKYHHLWVGRVFLEHAGDGIGKYLRGVLYDCNLRRDPDGHRRPGTSGHGS